MRDILVKQVFVMPSSFFEQHLNLCVLSKCVLETFKRAFWFELFRLSNESSPENLLQFQFRLWAITSAQLNRIINFKHFNKQHKKQKSIGQSENNNFLIYHLK